MKLVYVAGPYRAKTQWEVYQNIRRAEALALEVWKLGAIAICPHKNTEMFGGTLPDEVWLEGDLVIIKRCDAMICTSDWEKSVGANKEVIFAREIELPVFHSTVDLKMWLING